MTKEHRENIEAVAMDMGLVTDVIMGMREVADKIGL